MLAPAPAPAPEPEFRVGNIRVEGLQRVSEGTVYNYLPVNIGDRLTPQRLREAIRASKRELAARRNVEEAMQTLIPGAKLMTCSGFGEAIVRHMDD